MDCSQLTPAELQLLVEHQAYKNDPGLTLGLLDRFLVLDKQGLTGPLLDAAYWDYYFDEGQQGEGVSLRSGRDTDKPVPPTRQADGPPPPKRRAAERPPTPPPSTSQVRPGDRLPSPAPAAADSTAPFTIERLAEKRMSKRFNTTCE